jgi:peptidoglycan hydrolase CwlO-like protein
VDEILAQYSMDNIASVVIAIVGVLGGAGAWQYYAKKLELKHQNNKDQNKDNNLFRDQILNEVDRLKQELQTAQATVISLTGEVSTLRERVKNLEKENDRLKNK